MVAAHAVSESAARISIDAGVDEATMKAMAAKGVFLILTEATFENDDVLRRAFKMTPAQIGSGRPRRVQRIQSAMRAGVRIAFGSDRGHRNPTWGRGMGALTGLESYRNAGMIPLEAIRTATTSAAELLGLVKQIGAIEAGRYADTIG